MKYDLDSYAIPLTNGTVRQGVIVTIETDEGEFGMGEIAPLPGRSIETLDEAREMAIAYLEKKTSFAPPSVLFGVSCAFTPIREDLYFELTHLFDPSWKEGKYLKVKLGDKTVNEAIALTESIVAKGIKPHLDFNSLWDIEDTITFCKHFSPDDFRYLEDPVRAFTQLESFYEKTGYFFALDEYLLHHPIERIISLKGLSHLIIKPTLWGGYEECKRLIEKAPFCTPVFSSSYESAIGLMHIVRIAKLLSPNEPVGIDTFSCFTTNTLNIDFSRGFISHACTCLR